jgi:hypothetical protein
MPVSLSDETLDEELELASPLVVVDEEQPVARTNAERTSQFFM